LGLPGFSGFSTPAWILTIRLIEWFTTTTASETR